MEAKMKNVLLLLLLLISPLCVNFAHSMKKDHPSYGRYHKKQNRLPKLKNEDVSAIEQERKENNHSIDIDQPDIVIEAPTSQEIAVAPLPMSTPPSVKIANINAHSTQKVAAIAGIATVLSAGVTAFTTIYLSSCK